MESVSTNVSLNRGGTISPKVGGSRAPLLLVASILLWFLAIIYHYVHRAEMSGALCYELDAARMMLSGRLPYRDFYFDQSIYLLYWRSLSVWLAQMFSGINSADYLPLPVTALALGSFFATALTSLLSLLVSIYIVANTRLIGSQFRLLAAALLGTTVAELAVGFEFADAQHIACLFLAPYVILKCARSLGGAVSWLSASLAGLMAAFAAVLSPYFLAVPVLVEVAEVLAVRRRKALLKGRLEFLMMLAPALVLWYQYGNFNHDALSELFDWILPLKYVSVLLDQIQYFGLSSCPDRRDVFYCLTTAMILAFALADRLPLLRAPAVVAACGFAVYLIEMQGFSSEFLLTGWATAVMLAVQVQFFADTLVVAYPRWFRRLRRWPLQVWALPAFAFVVATCLAASFCLQRQLSENARMAGDSVDVDVLDLAEGMTAKTLPGDKVFIFGGHKIPAYPSYTMAQRQPCGYFTSTEPFTALANALAHGLSDAQLGKPAGWLSATRDKLFARMQEDILREKPALIIIETGEIHTELTKRGFFRAIESLYKIDADLRYHSSECGTTECADWNYRYNSYLRRKNF